MQSMAMVNSLCRWVARNNATTVIVGRMWFGVMLLAVCASAHAQRARIHYEHAGALAPGAIGSRQLQRGGLLRGFVQPVEIKAPQGALVSLAADGKFEKPQSGPRTVGMFIAPVYRMRVTNIPLHEGVEVYPTIEIIDRIYAPVGRTWQFPIPIELSAEELTLAIEGKFVTRVIYLEEPNDPFPLATGGKHQEYVNLLGNENPLEVADRLGRPVAVLRMGGRIPIDLLNPGAKFLYGSPPWRKSPRSAPAKKAKPVAPKKIPKKIPAAPADREARRLVPQAPELSFPGGNQR
jgi:hypothetical protein